MKKVKLFIILSIIPLLIISFSVLLWALQNKKPFNIFILDKTIPDRSYTEHKSFNWVLNYHGYANRKGKHYSVSEDYYGFFPLKDDMYKIKSLRLFQVLTVPDELDMVYYTDTYGVMYEDWYGKKPDPSRSPLLYGRLNQNDYLLLSEMRRKNKLIITEFNLLAPPTSTLFRNKIESLFDFRWTGWIGCYVKSLKAGNAYLPSWIQKLYEEKYSEKWAFNGPGIVLVNESGEIIVLESKKHLDKDLPEILTSDYGQKMYHLPSVQNFSAWFDIIEPGGSNTVVATYKIAANSAGKEMLERAGLSAEFPAVIEHLHGYKFYYFAGDFSDRSIVLFSSYLKGVTGIARSLSLQRSGSKSTFFWRYYEPLVSNIMKNNLH